MKAALSHWGLKDFEDLVRAAKAGSSEDLGLLLDSCRKILKEGSRDFVPPRYWPKFEDSDVAQEVLMHCCVHFDQFRGSSPPELVAWVTTVLRNYLLNLVRSFQTEKRDVGREVPLGTAADTLVSREPAPDAAAISREQTEDLNRAVALLPREEFRVLLRLRLEGLSFAEIGRQLGWTEWKVRKNWECVFDALVESLVSPCPE